MKAQWTLVATNHAIDSLSNQISLFNLIDEIQAGVDQSALGSPLDPVPITFELVTQWLRSDPEIGEQFDMRVVIRYKRKNLFVGPPLSIDLIGARRNRTITKITGLPVPENQAGKYRLELVSEVKIADEWRRQAMPPLTLSILQA